jgi:hypothetical protein
VSTNAFFATKPYLLIILRGESGVFIAAQRLFSRPEALILKSKQGKLRKVAGSR